MFLGWVLGLIKELQEQPVSNILNVFISKFNTTVEILKSSSTYDFAWQKRVGGGDMPPSRFVDWPSRFVP